MKLKKIIVEGLDGKDFEMETNGFECEFTWECGINFYHELGVLQADMAHNGQSRLLLKAWRGCGHYSTFQSRTNLHPAEIPDGES